MSERFKAHIRKITKEILLSLRKEREQILKELTTFPEGCRAYYVTFGSALGLLHAINIVEEHQINNR